MNDSIQKQLIAIKNALHTNVFPTLETLDALLGELEMIRMEIEQHLLAMPQDAAWREVRSAAEQAVQRLADILIVMEELEGASPEEHDLLVDEISALIDAIHY